MNPWESLVREHLPVVTGVALRVLGDRAAAEDVAQDVFLHLLENPHALDNAQNVRSFLCRSAINRSLDRIRERDRRGKREASVVPAPRDSSPIDAASHEEIRRSVEALPAAEREAVAARFFRGLTVREAASEMNVSVGTVCNRLEAGLTRLRKWLGAAAFIAMFAVLEEEAFAEGREIAVQRLFARRAEFGDGSREIGGRAKKAKTAALAVGALVAAILISIWIGRPGETDDLVRRPLEIASSPGAQGTVPRVWGDQPGASATVPLTKTLHAPADAVCFRAEGFLVRDGETFALVDPSWREPRRVEGPAPSDLASAAPRRFFNMNPAAVTGAPTKAFRLAPGDALASIPSGDLSSFEGWLDGADDLSRLPRARIVLRAAWIDESRGLAEALEIEETEILSDAWLTAWRDALAANASLAEAFDRPPGPSRRAEALAAADRLEEALSRSRAARHGEPAASWRMRRESELEIASDGALAVLGRDDEFPEAPAEMPDAEELAFSRAIGLELDPVPPLERSSLALRGGARIVAVVPGSVADRAGLQPGDIIWRCVRAGLAPASTPREILRPQDVSDFLEGASGEAVIVVMRGLEVFEARISL
ncbi:MAG: sigma-70 family RNA polymerase sigma factor [Planctomycetes bacterium]|nr:sigma-70 family RNA polymerase sigma factor [Planctomycetota bacterium]